MQFLLKASMAPAIHSDTGVSRAGIFSKGGISSVGDLNSLCDFIRLQNVFGGNVAVQLPLLFARLARACWRLRRT